MNPPINAPNSAYSGKSTQQTPEDEVSLIEILGILIRQKNLIFASIAILTLLSIGYVLMGMPAPTYQTTTSFLLSQRALSPKPIPNKNLKELTELKKSLYQKFLAKIQSYNFQKTVFDDGGFLKRFVGDAHDSTKPERVMLGIHNSITLKESSSNKKSAFLEMQGSKPETMEGFLNALLETAIVNVQNEALYAIKKSIDQRLKTISSEKEALPESLNTQAKKKQEVAKKKLVDARANAKKKLANEITSLTEQLNMARSLNIKENNFGVRHNAPKWFLYGEKILAAELKALESKAANLDNAAEPDNSAKLANVESLDKAPNIKNKQLLAMEMELEKWEATKASLKTPNIVVISQPGISLMQPLKPKGKIITTAMVMGLVLGVFIAFIKAGIDILREKKELPVKSKSIGKRFELNNDSKKFEFKNSPQTFHVHS
jgi:capsular polysaccharide biosynthesis protein